MGQVITITLNPAFDVHYELESFEVGKENYSSHRIVSIGGKGLNISRALKVQGVDSLAVIVLGEEKRPSSGLPWPRRVRCLGFSAQGDHYNITIHPAQGPETRLSLDNFRLDTSILEQIEQALLPQITPGTIIAFGSRVPRGLSVEKIKGFLARLKGRGAWLVLDSNSFSLQDLAELGPWLIKPNEYEIEALLGRGIRTEEAVLAAAREIHAQGVENVLISLGEQGLAYAGEDLCCRISVPKITPLSTIAAGDSVLAGTSMVTSGLDEDGDAQDRGAFGTRPASLQALPKGCDCPAQGDGAICYPAELK